MVRVETDASQVDLERVAEEGCPLPPTLNLRLHHANDETGE